MTTQNATRSAILDVAQDLIQRQSISGVSFQALAKEVGIKKGSIYYHFESKDELAIAVLERASGDLKASFSRGLKKTPSARLQYFFKVYRRDIGVGAKLCPGGAFVGEWDKLSAPVQAAVNTLINIQTQGIADIVEDGLNTNEFVAHGQTASQLALWIISSIQGALITGRVVGRTESFDICTNIVNQYLKQPNG